MTFTYNNTTYEVDIDSTFKDIIIPVQNLESACVIVNAITDMTSYVFNLEQYKNMKVLRRKIVLEGNKIVVEITLREQTALEQAHSAIEEMYSAIQEIPISGEDAAEHPCLFPDINDVDEVKPGCYYNQNGEVILIIEAIDEETGQWTSNPALGGGN